MNIQDRVKSLILSQCANHQRSGPTGIQYFCWKQENRTGGVCPFFSPIKEPQCNYFIESVLPLDKELVRIFSPEVLSQQIVIPGQKKCERCESDFLPRSNRQRFCPRCQKAAWNDKTRARMVKTRKSTNGGSGVTI